MAQCGQSILLVRLGTVRGSVYCALTARKLFHSGVGERALLAVR